jgi:hypothetical protein
MHALEERTYVSATTAGLFNSGGTHYNLHQCYEFWESCALLIPILILDEYNKTLVLFPSGLQRFSKPVGLVITPTKGFANNLVCVIPLSCTEYYTDLIDLGQRAVLLVFAFRRRQMQIHRRKGEQEGVVLKGSRVVLHSLCKLRLLLRRSNLPVSVMSNEQTCCSYCILPKPRKRKKTGAIIVPKLMDHGRALILVEKALLHRRITACTATISKHLPQATPY